VSKRVKLGPELKRTFAKQGFSMSGVAKELGLYENSLRSWIRRNRYPKRELLALCTFAGFGKKLETLQEGFQFDVAGERKTPARRVSEYLSRHKLSLDESLGLIEDHAGEALKTRDLFPDELQLLFRSMGQGDLYVHCALDRFPYEADGIGWSRLGRDLVASAARGASLVYMYPNDQAIRPARAMGVRRIPTSEASEEFMVAFKKRATHTAGTSVHRAFIAIQSDMNPFFVPGVQFLLFRQFQTTAAPKVFVVFPLATSSGERMLLLPAAESISSPFLEFLSVALEELGHGALLMS